MENGIKARAKVEKANFSTLAKVTNGYRSPGKAIGNWIKLLGRGRLRGGMG